ncbi:MAG: glycine--tRNA ligase [Candidatus Diapherotrites archaeon]|nr:glycine--tRNA ligase [Candidatus Diapherotrites archaeon]
MPNKDINRIELLNKILLQRGVIYPNSEFHGNISGFYDYGSIGSEIKHRWENYWRTFFLALNDNFHEIEPTTIMPEKVFKGSGHLEHFFDPVAECSKCGERVRADHIVEDVLHETFEGVTAEELSKLIKKHNIRCPKCGGEFKEIKTFTLMFPVQVGTGDDIVTAYLRPETAQGAYAAFKREFRVNRQRLPLGLAVVGRAYRNEISPRQGVLRAREFTQAELQIFFDPDKLPEVPFDHVEKQEMNILLEGTKNPIMITGKEATKKLGMEPFFVFHLAKMCQFMESMGFNKDNFRLHQLSEKEKAFYNKYHIDLECYSPSLDKWVEVAGFHYRTDHDLKGHQEITGETMEVSYGDGQKCLPHVLELSFGVDRNVFLILDNSLAEPDEKHKYNYLKLPSVVAPYDVSVYPLVNKGGLPEKAREVYNMLGSVGFRVFYDGTGSIGRRYARADEIGVPFGITIDFDTLKDNTVTIRMRDSTEQVRVKVQDICTKLWEMKGN